MPNPNCHKRSVWHMFSLGTKVLFFIQLTSILAFGVTLYTLGLYLVDIYKLPEIDASQVVATYAAINFGVHWLSGYLGDRWLSQRLLLLIGLLCQVFGCLLMGLMSNELLMYGLALQLTGNGLCITCINILINQQLDYSPDHATRESAFLWNYSAMNVGFFIALTICGYFQLHNQYTPSFLICAFSTAISTACLLKYWRLYSPRITPYLQSSFRLVAIPVVLVALLHLAIKHATISNHLILVGVVLSFIAIFSTNRRLKQQTRPENLQLFMILSGSALIFWTLYQLTPITLIFFIKKHVSLTLFGWNVAPQWFENINSFIIAAGGPLLAAGLNYLRKKNIALSLQLKFTIALALISFGLIILLIGIQATPVSQNVSAIWIVLKTIIESLAELILAPVGLAMIAVLMPRAWQGVAMGSWLMISGAASALAGQLTQLSDLSHNIHLVNNITYYMHTLLLAISIGVMCCFALLLSSPELDPTIE